MAVAKSGKKRKVAILGGGMAGLSAAWHLTHPDNPKSKSVEVTVYQQGWLLGGKCASTKNRKENLRIEEHGVHVFGGGYFNALHMMKECYDELVKRRIRSKSHPLGSFEKAFHRQDFSGMWWGSDMLPDQTGGKALITSQFFYAAPQARNPMTVAHWKAQPTAFHWAVTWSATVVTVFGARMAQIIAESISPEVSKAFADKLQSLGPTNDNPSTHSQQVKFLESRCAQVAYMHETAREGRKRAAAEYQKSKDPAIAAKLQGLTILETYLEFVSILLTSFVRDLLKAKKGFAVLDELDFIAWLKKNGASAQLIKSPIAISHPNILFAYPDGDTSGKPRMSAGVYLYWMLRISAYMGSYIYRFAEGTGETVITPLYQVLKKRGVKFEFFHTVRDVRLSPTGNHVDAIAFDVQAKPKNAKKGYDPTLSHKSKGRARIDFWPEEPLYDQLDGPEDWQDVVAETGANMDSFWWAGEPVEEKVLYRAEGFDDCVIAMSKEALHDCCSSLISRKPEWKSMMDTIETTPTQAIQLWFKKPLEAYQHPTITEDERKVFPGQTMEGVISCANYNTPFSCHVDFTDLIEKEGWPKNGPKGLVYFCGPMADFEQTDIPDGYQFPVRAKLRVEASAWRFLQTSAFPLLPKATSLNTIGYGDHRGLDFNHLYSTRKLSGYQRLIQGHYIRANVNPTDRYVLSVPGSADKRIRHDATGADNLAVAGDWTFTEINAGCVEGAVMSGKLASQTLTAWPPEDDIVGFNSTPWAK